MKKICLFSFVLLSASLYSCSDKEKPPKAITETEINALNVQLQETSFSTKMDEIDLTRLPRITRQQYDNMQLANVSDLEGYDISDLTMGEVLLENENGKILTLHIVTDGEVTEFLLSYDKNGKLLDNLLVAYEDMVEYYSEVTSRINANRIVVQTVNFTYGSPDGNTLERCDTVFANYHITPEFRFTVE